MQFKKETLKKEWNNAPLTLKVVATEIDLYMQSKYKKEMVVTRILGRLSGDSGIHAMGLALDARVQYWDTPTGKWEKLFTDKEAREIESHFNKKYPRTDGYNVILYHNDGVSTAPHFHIQAAPLTIAMRTETYKE